MSFEKLHLSEAEQQAGLLARLQLQSVNFIIFECAIIRTAGYSISSFFPFYLMALQYDW